MQPLRSSPITEPSLLLRAAPPLCPASVLWSLRFLPLGRLPSHRDDRFSRSIQEPDPASRRLHAGCRSGSLQDSPRACPGRRTHPRFRHHLRRFDTSSAVRSRSPLRILPDGISSRLFLQRSPPSLLTIAACSGVRPAPDCRPRGAYPHLLYDSTPPLVWRCVRDTRSLPPLPCSTWITMRPLSMSPMLSAATSDTRSPAP